MNTSLIRGLIVVSAFSAGCAAHAPDQGVDTEALAGAPPYEVIDEPADGQTFTVVKGMDFNIALKKPTPGLEWAVASTSRSLGYPSPKLGTYQPPPTGAAMGEVGKQLFTWKTNSPLLMPGPTTHSVTLEYRAAGESSATRATRTVTFKLAIEAATVTPPPPPPITLYGNDNGATVTAAEGQDVVVRLPQNASAGMAWFVESVDRTLGQPVKTVGNDGIAAFSWKTKGPLGMLGSHPVALKYSRGPTGTATQRFAFGVNIVAAAPGGGFACPPLATIDCTSPSASHYCAGDYRWFASEKCNVTYVD